MIELAQWLLATIFVLIVGAITLIACVWFFHTPIGRLLGYGLAFVALAGIFYYQYDKSKTEERQARNQPAYQQCMTNLDSEYINARNQYISKGLYTYTVKNNLDLQYRNRKSECYAILNRE